MNDTDYRPVTGRKNPIGDLAQESLFQVMADCAPVMLWISGLDARCIFFNKPWLEFTGRSLDQELGFGWAEGIHPEDFQDCMDKFMQSFNAKKQFSMEYRLRRADGQYRWLLDTGRPYFEEGEVFAGFIGSCVDVTSLKALREIEIEKARLETRVAEREIAAMQLQQANKELEAFCYTVSHDLRSPLRAVDGFVQAIIDDYSDHLPEEAHRYLGLVKDSATDMGQLIDDLLAFARLGRTPLELCEVDTRELVERIWQDREAQGEVQHIQLVLNPLPICSADPSLLKQVFSNLIDNAIKYSREKKRATVQISSAPLGKEHCFVVEDDGIGFDMQYVESIFGVFNRLHRSEEYEGTGVGLAIVKRIVQRHGGRVWAKGICQKGSSFYFTIPAFCREMGAADA